MLHQTFRLFHHDLGHLDVPRRWLVKGGADDLPLDRPLHVGNLLRPLVDQQDDQEHLRVIRAHGIGQRLQQHRLSRPWRRHDQAALPFSNRGEYVHHPRRGVVLGRLEPDPLEWIERGQVVVENPVAGLLRRLEVDSVDSDQRQIPLTFVGHADLP